MEMTDAEASETTVWLDFAKNCGYLEVSEWERLITGYNEIGRMLGGMANNPEKFIPKKK